MKPASPFGAFPSRVFRDVRARAPDEQDAAEQRRDEHHDDVLRRRDVDREAADVNRRPVRKVHDLVPRRSSATERRARPSR